MEMVVEASGPTNKHQLKSVYSDLSTSRSITSTTPKRWSSKAIASVTPIFCCDDCEGFMIDKEFFGDFVYTPDRADPSLENSNSKLSTRYFVCLNPALEYREVNEDFFNYFQHNQQTTYVMRSWFTCAEHQHEYHLSRFEYTEIMKEGSELKDAELSPQQFSKEKREIMVRNISYWRNDMMVDLARRLTNARKEDIDAVSRRLSFGRKEGVAEVTRRLSCGKECRAEEVDFYLARMSIYFSEARLC